MAGKELQEKLNSFRDSLDDESIDSHPPSHQDFSLNS